MGQQSGEHRKEFTFIRRTLTQRENMEAMMNSRNNLIVRFCDFHLGGWWVQWSQSGIKGTRTSSWSSFKVFIHGHDQQQLKDQSHIFFSFQCRVVLWSFEFLLPRCCFSQIFTLLENIKSSLHAPLTSWLYNEPLEQRRGNSSILGYIDVLITCEIQTNCSFCNCNLVVYCDGRKVSCKYDVSTAPTLVNGCISWNWM